MEVKISIVIPAYNAADFLPKCLDSILCQAMEELEVIVIDDGSTDGTPGIGDKYARDDPRVIVVHKSNAGVSEARNAGIRLATGEYVWFVDADDVIAPGACRELYGLAAGNDADVVVFDYSRTENGAGLGDFRSVFSPGLYEGDQVITELLRRFIGFPNEGVHRWIRQQPDSLYVENPALWRTLIRRELIFANELSFDPKLRVGEDTVFLSMCLSFSERVYVTHSVLYDQLLHSGSTVAKYEKDPDAKLSNKLALLLARRVLTEDIMARRGVDTEPYWQGTVIMSYMELCFLFARRVPGVSFRDGRLRFMRYAKDPGVMKCLSNYPPLRGVSIRNMPFFIMRLRFHRFIFLCAALLNLMHYKFVR
jgi:glycosyltransferase involved in cell wall biosynthesis